MKKVIVSLMALLLLPLTTIAKTPDKWIFGHGTDVPDEFWKTVDSGRGIASREPEIRSKEELEELKKVSEEDFERYSDDKRDREEDYTN